MLFLSRPLAGDPFTCCLTGVLFSPCCACFPGGTKQVKFAGFSAVAAPELRGLSAGSLLVRAGSGGRASPRVSDADGRTSARGHRGTRSGASSAGAAQRPRRVDAHLRRPALALVDDPDPGPGRLRRLSALGRILPSAKGGIQCFLLPASCLLPTSGPRCRARPIRQPLAAPSVARPGPMSDVEATLAAPAYGDACHRGLRGRGASRPRSTAPSCLGRRHHLVSRLHLRKLVPRLTWVQIPCYVECRNQASHCHAGQSPLPAPGAMLWPPCPARLISPNRPKSHVTVWSSKPPPHHQITRSTLPSTPTNAPTAPAKTILSATRIRLLRCYATPRVPRDGPSRSLHRHGVSYPESDVDVLVSLTRVRGPLTCASGASAAVLASLPVSWPSVPVSLSTSLPP